MLIGLDLPELSKGFDGPFYLIPVTSNTSYLVPEHVFTKDEAISFREMISKLEQEKDIITKHIYLCDEKGITIFTKDRIDYRNL